MKWSAVVCLFVLALAACAPAAQLRPEPTRTSPLRISATQPATQPASSPVPSLTPSIEASATPTAAAAVQVPTPSPTPVCGAGWCEVQDHFFLQAPIKGQFGEQVDPTYRYSSSAGGLREPHTGVEFQAPEGEPVRAAGDGRIMQAGANTVGQFAGLGEEYGNVVVIQHDLASWPQAVYSVYGHLSQMDVKIGDRVKTGQQIGLVGHTGAATGPHLHFEVRVGTNGQMVTQNPELWLLPLVQTDGEMKGAIAGRVVDRDGEPLLSQDIVLKLHGDPAEPAPVPVYLSSYATTSLPVDASLKENFAAGNLVPGTYTVTTIIDGLLEARDVIVFPGRLTLVNFDLSAAPPQ